MHESILLVEDEAALRATLSDRLRGEGYVVNTAVDGHEGFEKAANMPFDLVILDIMLPVRSGLDICRGIRQAGMATPILILTARDRVPERVDGLERGADDYLVKPFAFAELMARLRALLRRPARRVEPFRLDGLDIDLLHRRVLAHGRHVDLTRVEFDILLALAEARGDAVTRRDLLATVWGYRFEPGTNVVDVHVARLRRKLESAGAASAIRTVRGIGYALDA